MRLYIKASGLKINQSTGNITFDEGHIFGQFVDARGDEVSAPVKETAKAVLGLLDQNKNLVIDIAD